MSVFYLLLIGYALWVFYLAVMNLKRAKDEGRLSKVASVFGTPVLLIGALLDIAANLTLFSIICLDAPRELLVTTRLKRYASGPDGWRKRFALWFADDMLDDFDPSGKHI